MPPAAVRANMSAGRRAEVETLELLADELPDHFRVFFGVNWSLRDQGRSHAREVDFVVTNPAGKALLIEQKMGTLVEKGAGLFKEYDGQDKSVAQQIHNSRSGLMQQFDRQNRGESGLDIDYLLYCPNYKVRNLNAAGLDRQNIIDATDRSMLCFVIQKRLGGPSALTEHGQLVDRFFRNTLALVPDISSLRDSAGERFVQLLHGGLEYIEGLSMEPFRLRISGVAGCGKSQISMHFLTRAVERGEKALFVCFNYPLKEAVSQALGDKVDVSTFHGLIHDYCNRSDVGIEYEARNRSHDEWQALLDEIIGHLTEADACYDLIVVDEGQDIGDYPFEFVKLFGKEGCAILFLEDPYQDLNQSKYESAKLDGFVTLNLRRNYRNPLSVCRLIEKIFPDRFLASNDEEGLGVSMYGYADPAEQIDIVEHVIQKALNRGFEPGDIAIVSMRGLANNVFGSVEMIAGRRVRRFTTKYEGSAQVYTEGELIFETIRRFKGQQAPLVILTDVDPDMNRELDQNLLYCGLTRPTVQLVIVGSSKNAFCRSMFGIS